MIKKRKNKILDPNFWLALSYKEVAKGKNFLRPEIWDNFAKDYDDLENSTFYQELKTDVLKEMEKKGALAPHLTAIDVCCGTGSYTIELAKRVKEVWALDHSTKMLEILKKKIQDNRLTNVKILEIDWYKYEPKEKFDLVFVSMTPILGDLEQVKKLLNITKKNLVFVHWAGIRENLLLEEILQKFFPIKKEEKSLGIFLIFNFLYSLGYAPDLKFYHGYFARTSTVERTWERIKLRLLAKGYKISSTKEKRILEFLEEKAQNKVIKYKTKVRIGALFLDLKQMEESYGEGGNGS